MSVQPGPTFKRYDANGLATVYAIPFLLLAAADLQITLNGVPVTTGFALTGIGNPQSTCTFTTAPSGDLLFQMVVPFQRLADYQINGDFLAQTVNRDFDRLWLAVKQLNRDSSRALTVSLLEPEGIPPLPIKTARSLKVLAFDVNGNPTPSNLTIAQLEQQPALALESAAAAEASAEAAETAETSATESAQLAAKLAQNPEDVPVSPGLFSAFHWARKALVSASSAAATLANAVQKTGAQVMAGPLTVTNGISSIPFNKSYVSSPQVQTSGALLTLEHGLAVPPKLVRGVLICTVAELGYSIGFRMDISLAVTSSANSQGISIGSDATNIYVRFGSNATIHTAVNNTNGNGAALTNANWRLEVTAFA